MLLQDALKVNGKVRRPKWPADQYLWLPEDRTCFISCKEGCASHGVDLSVENILADDYEPYVKKEPCEHEPILPVHYAVNGVVSIEAYQDLEKALIFPKCKCGAKLKMEGKWVEV